MGYDSCGPNCQEQGRQDDLIPRVLNGSGTDNNWTLDDWTYYYSNRQGIWDDPTSWINPDPSGSFSIHVQRLANTYSANERDQFVRDFSLVFGGVPSGVSWVKAALSVQHGPHDLLFLNNSK
jgi:hypothetical protein